MKAKNKIICLMLSVCLALACTSWVTAAAAGGAPNVSMVIDATNVKVGDTVTVVIKNTDLVAGGFGVYLEFDRDLLECTNITGADGDEYMGMYQQDKKAPWVTAQVADSVADTNKDGIFSFGVAIGSDKQLWQGIVATLTFTAKATGDARFILNENTAGADTFIGVADDSQFITITEAPACDHGTTKLVSNNNGTHNKVCANADCGAVVTENVTCSGTEDYNCATAEVCACGYTVKAAMEHDWDKESSDTESNGDGTHTDTFGCKNENCTKTGEETSNCFGGTATCTEYAKCEVCHEPYGELKQHAFNTKASSERATAADCENAATYYVQCDNCTAVTKNKTVAQGEANGHGYNYDCDKSCKVCGKETRPNADHAYDNACDTECNVCKATREVAGHKSNAAYVCVAGKCEYCGADVAAASEHSYNNDCDKTCKVCSQETRPTAAHVYDNACDAECNICQATREVAGHTGGTATCKELAKCAECGAEYGELAAHSSFRYLPDSDSASTHTKYCGVCNAPIEGETGVAHTYDKNHTCVCGAKRTGWVEDTYIENGVMQTGWKKVGEAWYYFDATNNGNRAEGAARVPYQTEAKYPFYDEDKAYADSKPEEERVEFKDVALAWYLFDENGQLMSSFTGIKDGRYYVEGMAYWHPGFVQVEDVWYYFIGDAENGGNKPANGLIYVTRNCKAAGLEQGERVFFKDGQIDITKNGIVELNLDDKEGDEKYYFVNGKMMVGAGLMKLENGKYIYVRSTNGQLVVGTEYYVPAGYGVRYGLHEFDKNGYMVTTPELSTAVKDATGIYDGYYYENGHIQYGAGLVQLADGSYIYVRSNGKVQTGWFYITKTNGVPGFEQGMKIDFGADGKYIPET
jgi:glucan-binding YG repeat protein